MPGGLSTPSYETFWETRGFTVQLTCNKVTALVFPGINDSFPQPPEVTDMEFLWKETLCQRKHYSSDVVAYLAHEPSQLTGYSNVWRTQWKWQVSSLTDCIAQNDEE